MMKVLKNPSLIQSRIFCFKKLRHLTKPPRHIARAAIHRHKWGPHSYNFEFRFVMYFHRRRVMFGTKLVFIFVKKRASAQQIMQYLQMLCTFKMVTKKCFQNIFYNTCAICLRIFINSAILNKNYKQTLLLIIE